jgi:hypothetical protein
MLGEDSKKNIEFPVEKQGTPSVVVLEEFFDKEFIREANHDFEEFINKSSEVDFLSFGETRKNLSSRGSRYEEIVNSSNSIKKICEYIKSEEFFKKCIENSTESFEKKGLKIKIPKFNPNSYDSLRFAKKFSILWVLNKLRYVLFRIPFFGDLFERLSLSIFGKVAPTIDVAQSEMGYEVGMHTDSRFKLMAGIIYLNTTKNDSDGETEFWSSKGLSDLENQKRYPDREDIDNSQLLMSVKPKAGRTVLFINSNDAYHSVRKFKGTKRNIIYFSFSVPILDNIWKTDFKVKSL